MSTLQTTPQHGDRTRTRPGAKVLALSTLVAIGLALLILAHNQRATPPVGSTAHEASLPAQTRTPAGCFRDPLTHALACAHAAPSRVAATAIAGYYRDPVTHELLRLPTARHAAGQDPVNHSRGRIIP